MDNHSEDDLIEKFKSEFQSVLFLETPANLGFGGGCHQGVLKASKEYLLFLNPDTLASNDSIQAMLNLISTNKELGIVSCRQHSNLKKHFLLLPGLLRLSGIVRSIESRWIKRKMFGIKKTNGIEYIEPEWVSASVLMISKELYYEVGGWSKNLWMYFEDPDLCIRVRQMGLKIALVSNYMIRHEHGGATRLNKSTAILSKGEVLISRHVYIQEHFKGIERPVAHIFAIGEFLVFGTFRAMAGIIFFFIPVFNIQSHIWFNMFRYYLQVISTQSWISPKLKKI